VYNIIRNHRGVLTVDSEVGAGTTFTVYLPAAESKPAEQKPEQASLSSVGGMETILVVDDEPSMLELAKDVLEEHGYSVHTAFSGEEAVDKLRSMNGQISLVILDLMMKGMDGAQTFLAMRRIDPDIKAFFCTGYMPGTLLESLPEPERGRILHKPFAPQGLLQMVRSTIGAGKM
jgi:hypothetical protein